MREYQLLATGQKNKGNRLSCLLFTPGKAVQDQADCASPRTLSLLYDIIYSAKI